MGIGSPPTLPVPHAVSSRIYFASLIGPVLLSASLGIQMTLAAVFVVPNTEAPSDLTAYGRYIFIPERDIAIYLASTLASVLFGLAASWAWNRRLASNSGISEEALMRWPALQAAAAVGTASAAFACFLRARAAVAGGAEIPGRYLAVFAGVAAITIGTALLPPARRAGGAALKLAGVLRGAGDPSSPPLRLSPLDLAVPVVIGLLVYIPDWRQLAGRLFLEEGLFHWDFFAMGPALSFTHGSALGSEVHAAYGVGWAMVFSALSPLLPLSFGRMIQIGTIYACVYFTGVYALLRMLVRRAPLAALGTGLILMQLVLWAGNFVIWRFPSLTVMRWSGDVWCFIAVVLYARTGRRLWGVAAGASVGMALLFTIDTGLYLAIGLGFYWLCSIFLAADVRRRLTDAGCSVLAAFVVLLPGLMIAARGGLLEPRFWAGWLEAVLEFGGGFGMLPLATLPNPLTVASFALLFFIYLVLIVYCLVRLVHRRATEFELFNAFVSIYGLLCLIHFLGRSGDFTTFSLWRPLGLLLVILAGRFWDYAELRLSQRQMPIGRRRTIRALPFAAAAAVLASLASLGPRELLIEPVKEYPSVAASMVTGRRPDGLCLFVHPKDLCGFPERLAPTVNHVRAITARLRDIRKKGGSFAVVDETGSLFYLAADEEPFSRYPRIFIAMFSWEKVAKVKSSLEDRAPDFILTRPLVEDHGKPFYRHWPYGAFGMAPGSPFHDSWEELNEVIRRDYVLQAEMAPFQIWERAAGAAEPGPQAAPTDGSPG